MIAGTSMIESGEAGVGAVARRSIADWRAAGLIAGVMLLGAAGIGHAQLRGVQAEVTPLVGNDGVHAATEVRAAIQVQLPDGFHVQSDKPRDPSLIPTVLMVDPPAGLSVVAIAYPPSTNFAQEGAEQPLAVFEREFVIGVRLAVGRDVPPGELIVPVRLRYQACDDRSCFAPTTAETQWSLRVVPADVAVSAQHGDLLDRLAFGQGAAPAAQLASTPGAAATVGDAGVAQLDHFTVLASAGGYVGADDFLAFLHNAESGVRPRGLFDGRGPLAILLIVFLGGLALNLTPCVLPMIPINLAIIGAGAQAGSRRRGFLLGSTYGVAMAVVYGVLGLVVILTASTFGAINASPWFNVGIAALFVVLGLAMFDVIAIDFSSLSSRWQPGADRRGSFALAFTMGGVAALLAGACVAPVVIQVVLFSSDLYATGTSSALALPFVLGLGMAVPWPVAGAGLSALPKPGLWMVRVKQAFGVLILGTALYYGYLAYGLFSNRWVDASSVASSVDEKVTAGWHSSLSDGLTEATREQKLVLIDLWATWCKNCLTMDKTTFEDPAVIAGLGDYVKIKFQAEDPDVEPTKSVMARFNAIGLPTYVVLRPEAPGPVAANITREWTGGNR